MKFCNLILENWTFNAAREPCRYGVNYKQEVDAAIILYRTYTDEPPHVWAWRPHFSHQLYFLNKVYQKSFGLYIKGTSEFAQSQVDNFLIRVNNLKSMM